MTDFMASAKRTEELARDFEQSYPDELPARLEWWGRALGINRSRLLRMIGMSAQQADRNKNKPMGDVLESPEWEQNAQLIEASLHRLVALYHYDWRALAGRIHAPVSSAAQGEETSRVKRPSRGPEHLRYKPNGDAAELLINRISEGGPQALSDLLAYLTAPRSAARHAGF